MDPITIQDESSSLHQLPPQPQEPPRTVTLIDLEDSL